MPRSRQAEVQSVVSWHKLCARDTNCLTGLAEEAAKGARVLPTIWNTLVRERCAWQLRGMAVRQKADRRSREGSLIDGQKAHRKASG